MDTVFTFVLFVAIAGAIFSFSSVLAVPGSPVQQRLLALLATRQRAQKRPLRERVEELAEPLSKLLPKSTSQVSRTRNTLIQAGYRHPAHVSIYFGIRVLTAGLFVILGAAAGVAARMPLLLAAAALFGYLLPQFVLSRLVRSRQQAIRLALPDALDLSVVCVEAGLGLDQALQRVGQELQHVHPILSDELQLLALELRAGKPRADALRNLAARTAVDDMRALVAVLVQTDRFGTSIAQALRVQSDALRTERRQRAEEMAAKTTIKMVPVLVFFVFPPLFFVTLGPPVIELIRNVLPALKN